MQACEVRPQGVFQYVQMGTGEFGFTADGEQVFRVVFADRQPRRLTVQGRGLMWICDYIALHRMPWIRQADRDFRAADGVAGDEPIITRIVVEEWKAEEG